MPVHQITKSLRARQSPVANAQYQLQVLNSAREDTSMQPSFSSSVRQSGIDNLRPHHLDVLQINVGRKCNQSCAHCHVDAGPDRTEVMSKETLEACLEVIQRLQIRTVDITGGAPELNPNFRWFVTACRDLGCHIIDRCNLTIIVSNPKYHDLPDFFAMHDVELMCSLPHYSSLRTDHQRGAGVFDDSIRALKLLNAVGYGRQDTHLKLNLIHNPSGAFLMADQGGLELEFRRQLKRKYNIDFNHLYTLTNLPINRFLDYLIASGNYEAYMQTLIDAFNPATIDGLMCRNMISVGWDGYLYDCDFNQMLDLKVDSPANHISQFDEHALSERMIVVNQHCYGCTAGAGSSCGGTLT